MINGVLRAIELKLHHPGVWHFDQIAVMNDEKLKFVPHFVGLVCAIRYKRLGSGPGVLLLSGATYGARRAAVSTVDARALRTKVGAGFVRAP
ncbi:MAG: hypothetical protein ACRCUE_04900 [Bosea sp. (in: a-proteobacteria)]